MGEPTEESGSDGVATAEHGAGIIPDIISDNNTAVIWLGSSTSGSHPSENAIASLIQKAAEASSRQIDFAIDLPRIDRDIIKWISYAKQRIARVTMMAHETWIGEKDACRLADAGLDSAMFDIDGMQRYHDTVKYAYGAWGNAMSSIDHLVEAGIEVNVRSVLTGKNTEEMIVLMGVLSKKGVTRHEIVPSPLATASEGTAMPALVQEQYDHFAFQMVKQESALRRRGSHTGYVLAPLPGNAA